MCFLQLLNLNLKNAMIIQKELSNKCKAQNRQISIFCCNLKDSPVALWQVLTARSSDIKEIMIYSE